MTNEDNVNVDLESIEEDPISEKSNLVRISFYIPKRLKQFTDALARQDGISTSELFRHALIHGMSFYAERSNKFKVNESLRRRETENSD
jgi:hypothetical protein